MGKRNKRPPDEEAEGAPASEPVERTEEQPRRRNRQAFRGPTGYNYGEGYNFQGGRPPSKTDYDAMSPEQRAQIGLPNFSDWKAAAQNWRSGFQQGGGNYQNQSSIAQALRSSGAQSWDQIANVLARMGITNTPDEGRALYRRLQGAFQGNIDPSGRYHRTGDGQWVDVGTSDLAKRGIAGAADYWGQGAGGGIASVLAGLAGNDEQVYFDRLIESGDWTEWPPGSGNFFNDPGNDQSKRVWVNRNDLQVEGSGYRSRRGVGEGPEIDYNDLLNNYPGMRITDYLAQRRNQQPAPATPAVDPMADYWIRAQQAEPYNPYNNQTPTPQATPSQSTGAWGVSGGPTMSTPSSYTAPTQSTPSNYTAPTSNFRVGEPTGNRPANIGYKQPTNNIGYKSVNTGMTPFGPARKPRNIWGIG